MEKQFPLYSKVRIKLSGQEGTVVQCYVHRVEVRYVCSHVTNRTGGLLSKSESAYNGVSYATEYFHPEELELIQE